MSTLVVNANTSAVTILLPAISEDLDVPVAQLQWAVTGYMLVGAAVIVTSGALGDVLGRRRVFLAGLLLFVASCVLIALATGPAGVIGGRMIQGAAGSTILACGMSLLSVSASGASQMKAITLWGAASAAGASAKRNSFEQTLQPPFMQLAATAADLRISREAGGPLQPPQRRPQELALDGIHVAVDLGRCHHDQPLRSGRGNARPDVGRELAHPLPQTLQLGAVGELRLEGCQLIGRRLWLRIDASPRSSGRTTAQDF